MWLAAGMVVLYLYDSARLLGCNEVLLCRSWNGRWAACFGENRFLLRGKEPFLPNPFLPHRPLHRLAWNMEGLVGPSRPWVPPGNIYAVLAPFIWLMMFALFVLIPAGLYSRWGNLAIAAGIVLFYSSLLVLLSLIWFRRADYRLSAKTFAALAFESLTCPPFALNVVRHLSLAYPLNDDFLSVLDRGLDGAERASALAGVVSRLRVEAEWADETSERSGRLNSHLQFLIREMDSCRA